jgi:hypothetical protein
VLSKKQELSGAERLNIRDATFTALTAREEYQTHLQPTNRF